MRIHRVRIDNFRCLRDFEVSFCDASGEPRPLTVLVGPNMSGKTTVLDALHLVYACAQQWPQPKLRPGLELRAAGLHADPRLPLVVEVAFSLADDECEAIDSVRRTVLPHDAEAPPLPVGRIHKIDLRWHGGAAANNPLRLAHPLDRVALSGRRLAEDAVVSRIATEALLEKIGGLVYLDQLRSIDLRVPSTDTGPENELRERAGTGDLMPWLELASRLDQKWDRATQGESAWSRVKRLYADLASPTTIDDVVTSPQGFDLRLRCGGRVYHASGVSGGERQTLRLVVNLVALRAVRSVVLIDELELHLHPRWQRNLLHFCRRGGGGDNQFIVTTHSSSVLDYVDPADVVRLGGDL